MNKKFIVKKIEKRLKEKLKNETTGHDWWHAWRVCNSAKKIAKKEGGDSFVIELASLLHDVEDWKFNGLKDSKTALAEKWLNELNVDKKTIKHVCHIIKNVSFKGAGVKNKIKTIEGKIVQDADRLDVIGAIGIARTFTYGGYKNRQIYDPKIKPKFHKTFQQYKNSNYTSINHFYEKILLLKDRLNTKTAKKIAVRRHKLVEQFLKQFLGEWQNKI
jgi:uncharacterized protein